MTWSMKASHRCSFTASLPYLGAQALLLGFLLDSPFGLLGHPLHLLHRLLGSRLGFVNQRTGALPKQLLLLRRLRHQQADDGPEREGDPAHGQGIFLIALPGLSGELLGLLLSLGAHLTHLTLHLAGLTLHLGSHLARCGLDPADQFPADILQLIRRLAHATW